MTSLLARWSHFKNVLYIRVSVCVCAAMSLAISLGLNSLDFLINWASRLTRMGCTPINQIWRSKSIIDAYCKRALIIKFEGWEGVKDMDFTISRTSLGYSGRRSCFHSDDTTSQAVTLHYYAIFKSVNKQECIPLGCLPPASMAVSTARGCVYVSRRMCSVGQIVCA